MSNTLKTDNKDACCQAKKYLRQHRGWSLIAHRWLIGRCLNINSAEKLKEYQRAVAECRHRLDIIEKVKTDTPTGAWILFYRFIMGYRVQRTISELAAQQHIRIHERYLYRQQHMALLKVYAILVSIANTKGQPN